VRDHASRTMLPLISLFVPQHTIEGNERSPSPKG